MWLAQMLGISLQQHQWVSELQVWGHRAAQCSGLSISVWHRGTIEAPGGGGEAALGRADTKQGKEGAAAAFGFYSHNLIRRVSVCLCGRDLRAFLPRIPTSCSVLQIHPFLLLPFPKWMHLFERRYVEISPFDSSASKRSSQWL